MANILNPYYDTMALSTLIELLKREKPGAVVFFDFCYLSPTTLDSYRGYYEHLALGHAANYGRTVKDLLAECEAAVGRVHYGYKGGEYTGHVAMPVWVDNPGMYSGTTLTDVVSRGNSVVLVTGREED